MSHEDTNGDMFDESFDESEDSEDQWDMERELRGE